MHIRVCLSLLSKQFNCAGTACIHFFQSLLNIGKSLMVGGRRVRIMISCRSGSIKNDKQEDNLTHCRFVWTTNVYINVIRCRAHLKQRENPYTSNGSSNIFIHIYKEVAVILVLTLCLSQLSQFHSERIQVKPSHLLIQSLRQDIHLPFLV